MALWERDFVLKYGASVTLQTVNPRRGRWLIAAAVLGCVAVLPWILVTGIEVDAGWEDAIWRDSPWNLYAWGIVAAGAGGAFVGLWSALDYRARGDRRRLRLCVTALMVEVGAVIAWIGLSFAAVT